MFHLLTYLLLPTDAADSENENNDEESERMNKRQPEVRTESSARGRRDIEQHSQSTTECHPPTTLHTNSIISSSTVFKSYTEYTIDRKDRQIQKNITKTHPK